jgi:hypothetical protein
LEVNSPDVGIKEKEWERNGMGRMILRANALIGMGFWDREGIGNGREIKAQMDEQRSNVFKQIK